MDPHDDDDELLQDPGRGLGLRLLALLGAASVLMIGISGMLAPLLQPQPAPRGPGQRQQSSAISLATLETPHPLRSAGTVARR